MRYVMQTLFTYDNAHVVFFADRMEWTTDFDLYTDNVHYIWAINNAMGKAIAEGESELTRNNYESVLQTCAQTLRRTAEDPQYSAN